MKYKNEIFQLCVILFLMSTIFFWGSWLLIHYQNPNESFKEALGLTISFLAPLAAIYTSIVAVILYSDWKEPYNESMKSKYAEQVIDAYSDFSTSVQNFQILTSKVENSAYLSTLSNNPKQFELTNTEMNDLLEDIGQKFNFLKYRIKNHSVINDNQNEVMAVLNKYTEIYIDIHKDKPRYNILAVCSFYPPVWYWTWGTVSP